MVGVTISTSSAGDEIWVTVATQASLLPFGSGDPCLNVKSEWTEGEAKGRGVGALMAYERMCSGGCAQGDDRPELKTKSQYT